MSNSSLKTRKLRPLIPKPTTSNIPKNTTQYSMTNSCTYICSCNPSTPHFSLNHKMGSETNTQPISVMSSRWNPTPEQLCALEEMYVCGTRTPTAEQIQQIAAKLRKFGKIEGKNVFYWFQNHKARERQKRRRILESLSEEQVRYNFENPEGKETELNKTSFEVGQRKKWARATLSNCSTLSEECVSIHRAVLAAESETTDGWTQFEERESSIILSKNATWQTPSTSLLNTVEDFGTKESKLSTKNSKEEYYFTYSEDESRESKTLQLFPARNDEWNDVNALNNNTELPVPTTMSTNFTPNQYFEFLPLKH